MKAVEAAKKTAVIMARWPTPSATDEQVDLYTRLLEDLDAGHVDAVLNKLSRCRTERPDVAEIRQLVGARIAEEETGHDQFIDFDEAWGIVVEARRRTSLPQQGWPHPELAIVTEALRRSGEWWHFCSIELPKAIWQFRSIYEPLLQRAREKAAAAPGARPVFLDSHLAKLDRAKQREIEKIEQKARADAEYAARMLRKPEVAEAGGKTRLLSHEEYAAQSLDLHEEAP